MYDKSRDRMFILTQYVKKINMLFDQEGKIDKIRIAPIDTVDMIKNRRKPYVYCSGYFRASG